LAQTFLSNKIYDFIEANGGKTKLKNYAVLNFTHDKVNYYLKLVGVINLLTIAKIIFILITEKIINE
jgi:large-conductance mechanosensitive channel